MENISALTILKFFESALPLLTLPYLVKTLGIGNFGLYSFAFAFMGYFNIITNYGFDLTATRAISINRENKDEVQRIFSTVYVIKFCLLLLCLLLLILLVFFIPKLNTYFYIYLLAFISVVGNVLFPIWFFQGIEKMKYITFLNVTSRTLVTISIFIFIHDEKDILLALLINTLTFFLPGIIGFSFVLIKFRLKFTVPRKNEIIQMVKEGWHIFISSFLGNVIASSGVFILGITNSKEIVGIYSAIEKIIRAIIGFFMPITQALFPYVSAKFAQSYKVGLSIVKKSGKLIIMLAIFIGAIFLIFSSQILGIIYGNEVADYSMVMQVLVFWFIISIINNIIGYQFLIASGQEKLYSRSFIIAAVITIMLYILLAGPLSMYGIILAMLLGEISLTLTMALSIYRKKLLIEQEKG